MSVLLKEAPPAVNWSQNPVEFHLKGANYSQSFTSVFYLMIRVYMTDANGVFSKIGDDLRLQQWTEEGSWIDISRVLDDEFKAQFDGSEPVYSPSQNVPLKAKTKRLFYIEAFERYGVPQTSYEITFTSKELVVYYGRSPDLFNYKEFFSLHYANPAINKTLQLNRSFRRVEDQTPVFIPFYPGAAGTYNLSITVVMSDGTSQVRTILAADQLTLASDDLGIFPGGFDQLQLDQVDPAKEVSYWTIEVREGANIHSDTFIFIRDMQCYSCVKHLMFINPHGCPDIIRTTGKWERIQSINRHLATVLKEKNNNRTNSPQLGHFTEIVHLLRSGYMWKDEEKAMSGLLEADHIFTLEISSNRFYFARLGGNEFLLKKCQQNLLSYEARLIESDYFGLNPESQ